MAHGQMRIDVLMARQALARVGVKHVQRGSVLGDGEAGCGVPNHVLLQREHRPTAQCSQQAHERIEFEEPACHLSAPEL